MSKTLRRPTRREMLRELRTWEVFPRLLLGAPRLAMQLRGQDAPVMVIPGFRSSDKSTRILRSYLSYLGYTVRGWGLGVNGGNVPDLIEQILELVEVYSKEQGTKVHLVGWSLGGYLAREVARERPDLVRSVVTLGSPVVGGPKYTAAAAFYEKRGFDLDAIEADVEARYEQPLAVPVTAIYSRGDGIVSWEACIDNRSPQIDHIEVKGTHLSLGFHPAVLRLVAVSLNE